ncbi:rod shape-determining protein MreC [Arenimonas composti]|uniref:Cell shape-determining protein MreC n=1 Tax=Arenimonas composti TR7-09 = DSM 18010 TaxID=1121013 RepID=A0A091BH46_9GAMM|nr:rod shape-determining protein MreC [Arenimonas composti]KFN50114.1 hypothetical protein P873_08285 [Arenimonas composti TR7-09 = DSM 18010]
MVYPGAPAPRLGDSAGGTLPLLAWMALAVMLMVADQRGDFGQRARGYAAVAVEPVWWLAALPQRVGGWLGEQLASRSELQEENDRLRRELQVSSSRLHRLAAVAEENDRLRELLGGTRGFTLSAKLVGILDVDLDPTRQRLILEAGSEEGVTVGQAMIDAGGVLGQVIETGPHRATALLLTDSSHAIPVQVVRSGMRSIAYGTGEIDRLELRNIPQSGDIRVGDLLVTSGMGGRFPAGFPVGTVTELQPDDTRLFVVAQARPAARMDRGQEVLLVSNVRDAVDIGPPLPPPPEAEATPDPASGAAAADASAPTEGRE